MAGITERGITYAVGAGADRTAKDMDEGLPVSGHPTIQVIGEAGNPRLFSPSPGPLLNYVNMGPIYFSADIPIIFRHTGLRILLDTYFEDNAAGGAPDYKREYSLTEIPSIPSQFLSLWKRSEIAENDENEVYYGGVVNGLHLSQEEGQVIRTRVRADFAYFSNDEAASGTWAPDITGNRDTYTGEDLIILAGPYGDFAPMNIKAWSFTLSHATRQNWYKTQFPDRIVRRGYTLEGQVTFRNTGTIYQDWYGYQKDATPVYFIICFGTDGDLRIAAKIAGYTDSYDEGTTYRTYSLYAGYEKGSSLMDHPYKLTIEPRKA